MPACIPWKGHQNISQRFPFQNIFIDFAQLIKFLSSIKLHTAKKNATIKTCSCAPHTIIHSYTWLDLADLSVGRCWGCYVFFRVRFVYEQIDYHLFTSNWIVIWLCEVCVCTVCTSTLRRAVTFEIANFCVQFALLRAFFFSRNFISHGMTWPMDPNLISFRIFVRSMCGCWFDIAIAAAAIAAVLQPLPFFVLGFDFYFRSFGCNNNNS